LNKLKHTLTSTKKSLSIIRFLSAKLSQNIVNRSNSVTVCITIYHHIVIRITMHDHRNVNRLKMTLMISNIYRGHGIKGFYLGIRSDLICIIPSNVITFVVYEFVKRNL
jgi:hypothetical protein